MILGNTSTGSILHKGCRNKFDATTKTDDLEVEEARNIEHSS